MNPPKIEKEDIRSRFDITPEQYHAGLDKLWAALDIKGLVESDVFTLSAELIKALRSRLGAMAMCVLQENLEGATNIARQICLTFEDGPLAHIPWIEEAQHGT